MHFGLLTQRSLFRPSPTHAVSPWNPCDLCGSSKDIVGPRPRHTTHSVPVAAAQILHPSLLTPHPTSPSSNASFTESGMGSTAPCPTLLKVWISWLKGGLLLRLLGVPAALLAIHLEIYGSSPHASSLILHRLSRRLRLSKLTCKLGKSKQEKGDDSDRDLNSVLFSNNCAKVMAREHSRSTPKTPNLLSRKRSMTPDSKDRTRRPSPGASPAISSPQPQPSPVDYFDYSEASHAPLSPSLALPQTPSPQPRPLLVDLAEASDAHSSPTSAAPPTPSYIPRLVSVKHFEAPAPTLQPHTVKQFEPFPPAPQNFPAKPSEAPAPILQPLTANPVEASAPAPQPVAVKPIEPTHPPLPNSSAARVSLTPKPQPQPLLVEQVEAPKADLATSAAPAPPRPQPPPTALELEIFKAQLRSTSPVTPLTPSPNTRPVAIGRSKTTGTPLSNVSASRAFYGPKPLPHPSDAEAFEKFKAELRASSGYAFASPTRQSQALNEEEPDATDPSLSNSSNLSRPSPSTPSTPMYASRPSPHSRSMSLASGVKHNKRLSLQFPIQPSANYTPKNRPQSWVAAPTPMSPPVPDDSPTETNLLAILAAQERYVLELKEELVKAEEDLKTLKKHWANNEITKQRNDSRKVTQLQPLNTSLANLGIDPLDEDGANMWLQKETDRRKVLLSSAKASQSRKVFSGSRHLRTLSLLSPDVSTAVYTPSFPQPTDIRDGIDESTARPHTLIRHATTPDLARHNADTVNDDKFDLGGLTNLQREAIVRSGKKMATDFKDGLFSFIDDIRQATVGDEAVDEERTGSATVKGSSTKNTRKAIDGRPSMNRAASSKKSSQKIDAIADDFWKEHGLAEPKTASTNTVTHAIKNARTPQKQTKAEDEFEDWDNWDTPNDKYAKVAENHSSDSEEPSSPVSGPASSRTSTRYHSQRHDSKASSLTDFSSSGPDHEAILRDTTKRNSIPWPDLIKLSPTHLKRTASHLMKEWEKNLTPPPESRVSDHSSGDYIGRSAPPTDLI